ncbi:hypothetical protein [Ruminococcus sp.]|uniref:hypothetical protein n=1 Tax=Ruminococcus sp. TaxID=41978 RepID=UPI002C1DB824|nr:hypothetical protein [Ruminococcus sp.]HNZ98000.1 hypothetical protein [Ruminococcus sp.]HOH86152.1 hypothetical protein [Ruminococcus sp.]
MKKAFMAIIAAAAVMAFSAVSCGSKKEDSGAVNETTAASEEDTTEAETTDPDNEEYRELKRRDAEEGVDITPKPLPEYDNIPEDWKEISYERVSLRIPPDLEETEMWPSYVKTCYGKEDSFRTAYIVEKMESENGFYMNYSFPEITEEAVAEAFRELGIEYDGSQLSMYKAVLSLTSEMRTDSNAESFETAMLAKEFELRFSSEVYYRQINGCDVYYLKDDLSHDGFWSFNAMIFVSDSEYYQVQVIGDTIEEALMMCSTIDIK